MFDLLPEEQMLKREAGSVFIDDGTISGFPMGGFAQSLRQLQELIDKHPEYEVSVEETVRPSPGTVIRWRKKRKERT